MISVRQQMWGRVSVLFLVLTVMGRCAVAEEAILPEEEVTAVKVMATLKAAFIKCEIDEDGDVRIEDEGVITFVSVDPKRTLIKYFSFWKMKEDVPLEKKHELVNTWNNELIFVKFYVTRPTTLATEYWLTYENGIPPHMIVTAYRLSKKVVVGAISNNDPDDIIGD